jgi:hypothetical protein
MNFINIELKFDFSMYLPFIEGSLNIDNYRNIKLYNRTVEIENFSYFDINGFKRLCLSTNKLKDNEYAFVIIYYNDNQLLLSLQLFNNGKIKALTLGSGSICMTGSSELENYYCDIVDDYSRYLLDCFKENYIVIKYSGDMEYIHFDNYKLFMNDFKIDCDRLRFINQPNIERLEEPDEEKKSQSAPEPVINTVEQLETVEQIENGLNEILLDELLGNTLYDIDKYIEDLESAFIDRINSFTNEDFKKTYEEQIYRNLVNMTNVVIQQVHHKRMEVDVRLSKLYKTKQDELKKYNRNFKLIPKHLYNSLYNPDMECPCCLDYIDKNKFEMTICGHPICSVCLYNLPNNKCPTCKSIIE